VSRGTDLRIDLGQAPDFTGGMRFTGILLAGLMLTGCALFKSKPPKFPPNPPEPGTNAPVTSNKKLIVTPDTGQVGKVVQVNAHGQFVIVNFPVGGLPAIEQQLNVYRSGLKVGEVRISGPQSDDNTVGDIIQGEANLGDEVRAN
jgi:hypothetical protein